MAVGKTAQVMKSNLAVKPKREPIRIDFTVLSSAQYKARCRFSDLVAATFRI